VVGRWFSPGTLPLVSSTNKTYCHDIPVVAEILLKVALSTSTITIHVPELVVEQTVFTHLFLEIHHLLQYY